VPVDSANQRRDVLFALLLCMLSSLWCVSAATRLGVTFDEPTYLINGLAGWRAGTHAELLRLGTMPLPIDVQTLPLHLAERWRGTPFDAAVDLRRLLPWARAANLPFLWLLLIYAALSGRAIAGPWGGRAAAALVACEPNILAHAALATTDVAVSACLLAFAYHFHAGRDAGALRRVVVPGLLYGIAICAKASALLLGVLCALAIEVERARRQGPGSWRAQLVPWRRDMTRVAALGLLVTFVYCGTDWQPESSFVAWAHTLPNGALRAALIWTAENLCIFRNAGSALARQIRHNIAGHPTFLLGRSDARAIPLYFPILLTIKLSEPLLLGSLALFLTPPRRWINWAWGCAVAMLIVSLSFRVQLGIRMVLPVVALLAVGIASAATHIAVADPSRRRRRVAAATLVLGIAWTAARSLAVWPHGLTYVNAFWGGPAQGYRLVSDSNYDWGQGLDDLARWQERSRVADLDVWYYGTDPLLAAMSVRNLRLHTMSVATESDLIAIVGGRVLAVGATVLFGPSFGPDHERVVQILRRRVPDARTATFLLYDFRNEHSTGSRAGAVTAARAQTAER